MTSEELAENGWRKREGIDAAGYDIQGKKHDEGKLPLHLLPFDALESVTEILKIGANEYGERNWELGMSWSRIYGALLRHLFAWWRGEKLDPKSGKPHLWHAGCEVLFLISYELRQVGTDDRPGAKL